MTGAEISDKLLFLSANQAQAVSALRAAAAQEARSTFPERFAGKSDREIIDEIATVVRRAEEEAQT